MRRSRLRRVRVLLAREDGQALTEFAIIVTVLLLIVLGILDFGRAINDKNDETHVANLVARAAAVGQIPRPAPCGTDTFGANETLVQFASCEVGIDSKALQSGSGNPNDGPSAAALCVSIPDGWTPFTGDVEVKLTTTYNWFPFLNVAQSTIGGSATQQIETTTPQQSNWTTQSTPCP